MTRWVVIFTDTPDMLEIRGCKTLCCAHVAFAKAHPELLIGGGLKPDPDSAFCGALWVVEADDKTCVESLIRADPFSVPAYRRFEIFAWGKLLEDQMAVL